MVAVFPLKDLGQFNIASIVVTILDQRGNYYRCFVHNESVMHRTASMEFGFRDVYHLSQKLCYFSKSLGSSIRF